MADRMKRGEHRSIISDDELVWEHAGGRMGSVFIGRMQLVLGDGSGSWKRNLYEVLEGAAYTCSISPLCVQPALGTGGAVLGREQRVLCSLAVSCGLAVPLAGSAPGGCALCCWRQEQCGVFAAQGVLSHLAGTKCAPFAL